MPPEDYLPNSYRHDADGSFIWARTPSPVHQLPDFVQQTDTVYWWVGAMVGENLAECAAIIREAHRERRHWYTTPDGPFTLLVVRGS